MTKKGLIVATAVAGLFAVGAPMVASAKKAAKAHCEGVNECKGKGGCKSASNDCKGKNECKGKGWTAMAEKDCTAKGGTVAPAK